MNHFCTYFDRNYLTRGLALYRSLETHCRKPFELWILCFDNETHAVLSRLKLAHARLISADEFEAGDEDLVAVKAGRTRVEYFWTCTPALPLYVLKHNPGIEQVTYLDADVFFFNDPQPVLDELGNGSILMFEHRYPPQYLQWAETSGIYNVEFLTFRRDSHGMACLEWWRKQCLKWCFARKEDGLYGDQKYLEEWPSRFAGVVIAQHKGAGVAPWNMCRYRILRRNSTIIVDDVPLIFFHFHSLRMIHPYACQPNPTFDYVPRALALTHLPYMVCLREVERAVAGRIELKTFEMPDLSRTQVIRRSVKEGWVYLGSLMSVTALWALGRYWRKTEALLDQGYAAYKEGESFKAICLLGKVLLLNPCMVQRPGVLVMLVKSAFVCVPRKQGKDLIG